MAELAVYFYKCWLPPWVLARGVSPLSILLFPYMDFLLGDLILIFLYMLSAWA